MASTPQANTSNVTVLQTDGNTETVGTPSVIVFRRDPNADVLECRGTTVPTAGDAGYATGCTFYKSNGSTGTIIYINEGSATSANFHATAATETVTVTSATIATTSSTTGYAIAPKTGTLISVDFGAKDALAASDTNYIAWTITNLGQAGAGSTAMLATTPAGVNTTKVTGGTAITAEGVYALTLSGTGSNLVVAQGDQLKISATATGTLANTVTFPRYQLRFA
jgi:hypothetical protein